MGSSSPSPSLLLLFSLVFASSLLLSRASHETTIQGIDPENPALDVTPSHFHGRVLSHDGSEDFFFCERVKVSGHLRWKLSRYASSFRVTLAPAAQIPERLHSKIQVCFHRNASLGLCQCEKDDWKTVQKGLWTSVMSPYEERYVDVKFIGDTSGSVSIAVDEDLQQWRLICLAVGFVLLLLAPIVSSWVPFYYSTSMAIGVFLVIIILLFQGMKLLPAGRKSFFYLSIYGSVLGAGTFILHQISTLVNSILVNFGLSDEMHNPVYIFILVGIVLTGAALGFWMVRKFVISKDGSVDDGVAQFVKWAMRMIASTFILQCMTRASVRTRLTSMEARVAALEASNSKIQLLLESIQRLLEDKFASIEKRLDSIDSRRREGANLLEDHWLVLDQKGGGGGSCLPCTPEEEKQIVEELNHEAERDLKWERYVGQGLVDNLDNRKSLESQDLDEPELVRMLREGKDYVLVPKKVWEKLLQWYKGGPTLPRKMISQGVFNKTQFNVEVYPLRLKLIDSRDDSESTIQISKKASLQELYERVCSVRRVEREKASIWDYYNKQKSSQCALSCSSWEDFVKIFCRDFGSHGFEDYYERYSRLDSLILLIRWKLILIPEFIPNEASRILLAL